jgi:hypothetical protein
VQRRLKAPSEEARLSRAGPDGPRRAAAAARRRRGAGSPRCVAGGGEGEGAAQDISLPIRPQGYATARHDLASSTHPEGESGSTGRASEAEPRIRLWEKASPPGRQPPRSASLALPGRALAVRWRHHNNGCVDQEGGREGRWGTRVGANRRGKLATADSERPASVRLRRHLTTLPPALGATNSLPGVTAPPPAPRRLAAAPPPWRSGRAQPGAARAAPAGRTSSGSAHAKPPDSGTRRRGKISESRTHSPASAALARADRSARTALPGSSAPVTA